MSFFNYSEKVSKKSKTETVEVEIDTVKVRGTIKPQKDRYILQIGSKYIHRNPYQTPLGYIGAAGKNGQLQDVLEFTDCLDLAWSTENLTEAVEVKEVYGCKILKLQLERAVDEME